MKVTARHVTDTPICEGNCEKHGDNLYRVIVSSPVKYWGEFIYCDKAIAEDRRRGLGVEIVETIARSVP